MADVTPPEPVESDVAPDAAPIQASIPSTLPTLTSTPTTETETAPPVATLIRGSLRGDDWDFALPDEDTQRRIQKALADKGIYPGRQNGKWGGLTVASIETSVGLRATQEPSHELAQAILEATGHTRRQTARLDQGVWSEFASYLEAK